jgi:GNAT superfamily N-acetyltransferase
VLEYGTHTLILSDEAKKRATVAMADTGSGVMPVSMWPTPATAPKAVSLNWNQITPYTTKRKLDQGASLEDALHAQLVDAALGNSFIEFQLHGGLTSADVTGTLDQYGELVQKYSPAQPRDDHGRWTDGFGGSASLTSLPATTFAFDQPEANGPMVHDDDGRIMVRTERANILLGTPDQHVPLTTLYRAISEDEFKGIAANGYMQSDGRMNLEATEGTVVTNHDPSFYLPQKIGERGRIVALNYQPEDQWRVDTDGYAKTNARIPAERIRQVSDWTVGTGMGYVSPSSPLVADMVKRGLSNQVHNTLSSAQAAADRTGDWQGASALSELSNELYRVTSANRGGIDDVATAASTLKLSSELRTTLTSAPDFAGRADLLATLDDADQLVKSWQDGTLVQKYNPGQPRDSWGRWTDGGFRFTEGGWTQADHEAHGNRKTGWEQDTMVMWEPGDGYRYRTRFPDRAKIDPMDLRTGMLVEVDGAQAEIRQIDHDLVDGKRMLTLYNEVGWKVGQFDVDHDKIEVRHKIEVRKAYDPNQPRDRRGRWTDGIGGYDAADGNGPGEGHAGPGGQGRVPSRVGSARYDDGPGDSRGHRRGVVLADGTTVPTLGKVEQGKRTAQLRAEGKKVVDLYEVDAKHGAGHFRDAISQLKKNNPYHASVYVYDEAEYRDMRLFLNEDATAGIALHGDEIVSVFVQPNGSGKGGARSMVAQAVEQGGRRLDAFETVLPHIYAQEGFEAKARIPFNDEYAPDGWDYGTYAQWNNGRPDVVFMAFNPDQVGQAYTGGGKLVDDYDEGLASTVQKAIVLRYSPRQPRDDHGRWTDGPFSALYNRATGRGLAVEGRSYVTSVQPDFPDRTATMGETPEDMKTRKAMKAAVEKEWNGKRLPGLDAKVSGVRASVMWGDKLNWSGQIVSTREKEHGEPKELAHFKRTMKYDRSGNLIVAHHLLVVEKDARGKGIGTAFSHASEDWYKSIGVQRIEVEAALTKGGYTWAKAGYQWQDLSRSFGTHTPGIAGTGDSVSAFGNVKKRILGEAKTMRETLGSEAAAAHLEGIAARLDESNPFGPGVPSPADIANLRIVIRNPSGEDTTISSGRRIMEGSEWYGEKALGPEIRKSASWADRFDTFVRTRGIDEDDESWSAEDWAAWDGEFGGPLYFDATPRIILRYSPSQPRDDHGRWTDGMGGGFPAKPLDAETHIPPLFSMEGVPDESYTPDRHKVRDAHTIFQLAQAADLRDGTGSDVVVKEMQKVYGEAPLGAYTVKVERAQLYGEWDENGMSMTWAGTIRDGDRQVGTFQRTLDRGYDGELRVYHDSMFITHPADRGKGFSSAFSKKSLDWYNANGVHRVGIHAVSDGAYVWGKMGFEFDSSNMMHSDAGMGDNAARLWQEYHDAGDHQSAGIMSSILESMGKSFRVPEWRQSEVDDLYDPEDMTAYEEAEARYSEWVDDYEAENNFLFEQTPWELANMKDAKGKPIGRELMTGGDWHGVLGLQKAIDSEEYPYEFAAKRLNAVEYQSLFRNFVTERGIDEDDLNWTPADWAAWDDVFGGATAVKKYSPSQPRDDHGRFSSTGGATIIGTPGDSPKAREVAARISPTRNRSVRPGEVTPNERRLIDRGERTGPRRTVTSAEATYTGKSGRTYELKYERVDDPGDLITGDAPLAKVEVFAGPNKGRHEPGDLSTIGGTGGDGYQGYFRASGWGKMYASGGELYPAEAAEVDFIEVAENYRRDGVGTAMLELARRESPLYIDHSSTLTEDGSRFSEVVKYSPDQPRDERGRWTSGFGQLAVKTSVEHWNADTIADIAIRAEPSKVNKKGETAKSNVALVELWEHQGFNRLPAKVKELDPNRRMWRGEESPEHVTAFLGGDRFGNSGMYGNGTYFGTQVTAGTYAGGDHSKMFPAQWKEGANVKAFASQDELFSWAKSERAANLEKWRATGDTRFADAARIADSDPGTYASLVGLDGYTLSIADPWAASEGEVKLDRITVVLNRGALEVLE